GFLDWPAMRLESARALADIGITLKAVITPTSRLSGGEKQAVAITRAVKWARRLIFMDEPTAALGIAQAAIVLETIKRIRSTRIPVVLISHNLNHVFQVADRIVVLRLGRVVTNVLASGVTSDDIVAAITGSRARAN